MYMYMYATTYDSVYKSPLIGLIGLTNSGLFWLKMLEFCSRISFRVVQAQKVNERTVYIYKVKYIFFIFSATCFAPRIAPRVLDDQTFCYTGCVHVLFFFFIKYINPLNKN